MENSKSLINSPFILGCIITIIAASISLLLNNWSIIERISGTLGIICFVMAGVLIGAFTGGRQQRANFFMTNKKDRIRKDKVANYMILLGLPNIIGALIGFLMKK